jgi:DNA-binding CsgD family transcriptional regulator
MDLSPQPDLIGSIYDAVIEPTQWSQTLDRVRCFLGLQNAMLSVNALPTGDMSVHATSNIPPDLLSLAPELGEQAMAMWGGPAAVATLPLEKPLIQSKCTPRASWAGNGYYERFAKPQGAADQVMLILENNPRLVGTVGFARHESMPPISKRQTKALSLLAPHFRRAAVLGGLLARKSETADTFGTVIDALRAPVFLVRSNLSVVHQNAMGSHLLNEFPTLRGGDGRLRFPAETTSGQIEAVVQAAMQDSEGLAHGGGLPFRPNRHKTLIVHVLPLKRRTVSLEPAAVAALFIVDPAAPIDYRVDTAKCIYGLRPTQARVLEHVLRGMTGPQVANELSIAHSTVKTHMLSLFEKFGVSNKVELVSAVFAATQTVFL